MNAPVATNVPDGYREPADEQYRDERHDLELLRDHERELSSLAIVNYDAKCRGEHEQAVLEQVRELVEQARTLLLDQTRD